MYGGKTRAGASCSFDIEINHQSESEIDAFGLIPELFGICEGLKVDSSFEFDEQLENIKIAITKWIFFEDIFIFGSASSPDGYFQTQ